MPRRIAWTKSELAIIVLPVLGLLLFAGWSRFKPTTQTVEVRKYADDASLVTSPDGKIAALWSEATPRFPSRQNVLGSPPNVTSLIALLDIQTSGVRKELISNESIVFDSNLVFSPDGAYLAATYCDPMTVRVPKLNPSRQIRAGDYMPVFDRYLFVWDVKTGQVFWHTKFGTSKQFFRLMSLEWSRDGKALILDGIRPRLADLNQKKITRTLPLQADNGLFCDIRFAPDGRSWITNAPVSSTNNKRSSSQPARWSMSGHLLQKLPWDRAVTYDGGRVTRVGQHLEITASGQKHHWLVNTTQADFDWDVQGRRLYIWEQEQAVYPDVGSLGRGSSTVSVWDLQKQVLLWQASTDRHIEKCFPSPDGRFLASIGQTPTRNNAKMGDHWNNPRQVVIWRANGVVAQKINFTGPALTFTWAKDSKSALWSSGETVTYWKAPDA